MSKERLEEIPSKIALINHSEVVMDIKEYQFLYKQAKRVQELELRYGFKESQKGMKDALYDNLKRKNKQLKSNLNVYKGYYNNTLKHNKELIEQNKRYRDEIKSLIKYIETTDSEEYLVLGSVHTELKFLLESESND